MLKVALLHLAPRAGNILHNRLLIERGVRLAAAEGCNWAITPELAVCGYTFAPLIGTDRIEVQPDRWMSQMGRLAAKLCIYLFLSAPERDEETNCLHNSVFVFGPSGHILGRHRKIKTLRVGSESWSSPGGDAQPIVLNNGRKVGAMICADAYSPNIPQQLQRQGASILVSPAAWAPGPHGPKGEWERSTVDTVLPLFVCNRTGRDTVTDFTPGESVVAYGGRRLASASSRRSAAFMFTLKPYSRTPATENFYSVDLE